MKKILIVALGLIILASVWYLNRTLPPGITVTRETATEKLSIFPYTCIDTMKVSRDRARELNNNPEAERIIDNQIHLIKSMGANCVAIATPYDEEFLPYMKQWVDEARRQGLSVWFRGNWSAWEEWFDYREEMTPEMHMQKTTEFIRSNPDLFQPGDIFSPIVEPENGGPFKNGDRHRPLQQFIQREQEAVQNAFRDIGVPVHTNWISMSGGVARSTMDQRTVDALGGLVTLDHYVSHPDSMREYIDYFHTPFNAQIVFGEFGAPIPDLNGEMDEKEQAEFVDALLWELFLERDKIEGVNYWTLSESSTALINGINRERLVTNIIRKYYFPSEVLVKATDNHGRPIENVIISTNDNDAIGRTDEKGEARIIMPQGDYDINLTTTRGKTLSTSLHIVSGESVTITATFGE